MEASGHIGSPIGMIITAAVGAVCITATILGFQYAIYTIWLVSASAAADGDELPLASGTY